MSNIILGRYIDGDSIIHRMDSRAKLILSLYFIVIVFYATTGKHTLYWEFLPLLAWCFPKSK